jgi:hypothetical protein
VCNLLEVWIRDYPHDFAVGTAADALNALVKFIAAQAHLLHRASNIISFLEGHPLQDKDAAWALKIDEPFAEDDEPYSFSEDDDNAVPPLEASRLEDASSTQSLGSTREREPSLPLYAWSNGPGVATSEYADSAKEILKCLLSTSAKLSGIGPHHVAEEITRVGKFHFLLIEVRNIGNFRWRRCLRPIHS